MVLADRMGCLKGGVVANRVVPTGAYLRFAAHHGFRPDFCEAADPESKGIMEKEVGPFFLGSYLGPSEFDNAGRRVVVSQWLLQTVSDSGGSGVSGFWS